MKIELFRVLCGYEILEMNHISLHIFAFKCLDCRRSLTTLDEIRSVKAVDHVEKLRLLSGRCYRGLPRLRKVRSSNRRKGWSS